MHLNREIIALAAIALIGSGIPTSANALGEYIDVRIVNPGTRDSDMEVIDNICERVVLSKPMVAESMLAAQICAHDMGKGDLTIRNSQTGAEQRHRDVMENASVPVP
ncbi:MAG: hypothetical protein WBG92_02635 [Thiohalocapsa sp.]